MIGRTRARRALSRPVSAAIARRSRSREVCSADDDEERRSRPPSERRPGRPRRRRQDDARRAAPLHDRRDHPAGPRRRRDRRTSTSSPRSRSASESLSLAVATFEHDGTRITLVDTPGYADFVGRGRSRASQAADGALFVMDASGGVEAGLETAVALGRAHGPGGLLLHQPVRSGERGPDAALDALRAAFGNKIAPLQLAIGTAESFRGYVDLVHRKAWTLRGRQGGRDPGPGRAGRRGRPPPRPAPRGRRRGRRRRPDQVPRGRGDQRPGARGLPPQGRPGLDPGAGARRQRGDGHRRWRRSSTRSSATCPPPPRRAAGQGDGQGRRAGRGRAGPDGPLLAQVFKTAADPFVGRLTYFRVLSGTIHWQDHVWNAESRRGGAHRPGAAPARQGAGADRRAPGRRDRRRRQARPHRRPATRCRPQERPFTLPPIEFPEPTLPVAIEPQTKADLDKMGAALQRLLEEEPTRPRRAQRRPASSCSGRRARTTSP